MMTRTSNTGKNDTVDEKVASERKLWIPVLNWMAEVIKERLRRGRQALLLGPLNSELWETWALRGLLSDPGLVDSSTLEPLEKIGFDMCSFGLTGKDTNLFHKKPMGALTTSRALKEYLSSVGRCRKDHEHEHLAGRGTCRDATFWTPSLRTALLDAHLGDLDHSLVRAAFPAEAMEEERLEDVGETDDHTDGTLKLDAVYDAQDLATMVPKGGQIDEQALVDEETPNPDLEKEESSQMRERRAKWRALPQATRIAVRRLHTMTGHSSIASMQRLLRTAGGDPDVVRALPYFHCAACAERKKPAQPPATRPPSDYRFNVEVSLDCFEVRDVNRHRYTVLSAVCMGTLFHAAAVVSPDGGVPSSKRCLDAFRTMWLNWAGPPRRIVLDRGTHNRGVFSENMTAMGIELRFVGTEAPYQLGRGERQGAVLKQIIQHVIEARQLDDLASIELLLPEATFVKNNRVHHGGFTPSQWTLGRMPIEVDALTSEGVEQHAAVHEETLDPETEFGKQVQLRMAAKEAFSYVDSAHRIRAAMLRKMTPQRGPFAPGDLVCFYRKSRGIISRGRWMGPARVLGLEGRGMAWLIHGGIPITASVETLRFATGGEIAAKRNLELRPSRKRRRELVDPDEEFEYPFGDDLVGSPVARSTPGEAQQLPFFQADEPDAAYSPDFSPDGEGEQPPTTALPGDGPPPGLPPPGPGPPMDLSQDLPPVQEENEAEPEEEMVPPSLPMSRATSTQPTITTPSGGNQPDTGASGPAATSTQPTITAPSGGASTATALTRALHRSVDVLDGVSTMVRQVESRSELEPARTRSRSPFPTADSSSTSEAQGQRQLRGQPPAQAFVGFLARRSPKTAAARAKELHLHKAEPQRKLKMLEARAKEWANWTGFEATKVLSPSEAAEFRANNPEVGIIPTRWVDTLKSQPWEEDRHKARLVVRGDLEDSESLRTDSPTCSQGMLSYILAFAASRKKPIFGGDITAAFLQGERITRQLVLALPKDGVEGVEPGSLLVANKPVYGTRDAPRGFWKKLNKTVTTHGLRAVPFEPGAYTLTDDSGHLLGMMVSHVDDLLWSGGEAMSAVMEKVQADLKFGSLDEGDFTYCGRKIAQESEGIRVTCPNTAAKVRAIAITGERRKQRDATATAQEISQLRSVLGSLNWVARVCRPDISYELSALQAVQKQACVQDLLDCNKLLRYVQETPDVGIYYKYGAVDVDRAVVLSITDASYANDNDVAGNGVPMGNRSQSGRLLCLANPEFLETGAGDVYLLQHHSNVLRRVCRSTLQA